MSARLRKLFNIYQIKLAQLGGQRCNIYRPDYTVVDNTLGSPIYTGIKIKAEATSQRLVHLNFGNASYAAVFGNRNILRAGDVIVPTESGSTTPALTIINISPMEEILGLFTPRVGRIMLNVGTDVDMDTGTFVYKNVRYQWITDSGFPGSSFTGNLSGALSIPTQKLIFFTRNNTSPQDTQYEVQGLHFIEDDGDYRRKWVVKLVEVSGNLTQFTVEQDH